jgi:hypothetical protein
LGVGGCSVEDMFEATVSGSAQESGDPVACPDKAARCDSADLIDRLVMLRAEAARREAEMLALMAEFVEQRKREDAGGPGERFSEGFAVHELALALVRPGIEFANSYIWRRR